MTSRKLRFATLILMAWANIYCCCKSASAAPSTLLAADGTPQCCAHKQAPQNAPQKPGDRRAPVKCDECPFYAIRQNTVLSQLHIDIPAPQLCGVLDWLSASQLAPAHCCVHCIDTIDPPSAPTALLDLHTSLLR